MTERFVGPTERSAKVISKGRWSECTNFVYGKDKLEIEQIYLLISESILVISGGIINAISKLSLPYVMPSWPYCGFCFIWFMDCGELAP